MARVRRAPWQRPEVLAIALFCLTLLLYAPARNFDYISFDDHAYTDPSLVQNGLTWQGVRWAFTTGYAANWHPLTWLSHMTDMQIFGPGPAGPHFVNAVLHAINALLVFAVLSRLNKRPWPSLIVAGLFALHPLRVESVAWVAERKDLLSSLFFLLTLAAWTRYARASSFSGTGAPPVQNSDDEHGRGARATRNTAILWYVAALLLFALGLLAKPMLVTLPCVLLLLDFWPLQRTQSWRRIIVEKIPLLLIAVASRDDDEHQSARVAHRKRDRCVWPVSLENHLA